MRVHVVDPPAYTPPYDHHLGAALARAGAEVELWTSAFAHGEAPAPEGYRRIEAFYRRGGGRIARAVQHVPGMLRYRGRSRAADVVHFQWLPVQQVDPWLLPRGRPVVLTAHDVLPREASPGQRAGQRRAYARVDAVVVHSEHGARRLRDEAGVPAGRVHVIPHGAFPPPPGPGRLPGELEGERSGPVVLFFGLIRPYKGLDVLLDAWRSVDGAQLWVVGNPRMEVPALPAGARSVLRFVSEAEASAAMGAADLVVLPYREIDQSGVLWSALGHGKPVVASAVGGFPELAGTGAVELVPAGDAGALAGALRSLVADPGRRAAMSAAAQRLAEPGGPYGWDSIAARTLALYESLL